MTVGIVDHGIFADAWSIPELRALFDDRAQIAGWIEVMAVLAETEAEFGLIPEAAAEALSAACRGVAPDEALLQEVREDFQRSNHSLLGLIRALQRRCPGDSGEWLCYGATVQDITDSHTARVLLRTAEILRAQLRAIAEALAGLARLHRNTPLCGRTHGQPGLPITFGFKAAGWLDEILRHQARLERVIPVLGTAQLAGGVGSLSSFGDEAIALQARFCQRLGLMPPAISWTASRDRLADWLNLLALMTATADRIGHEVYNLQRPEIGELSEGFVAGTVGSITMPQKRNPEISEHLGTLARSVRHQAAFMLESLVHDHERDGRSWKGEWAILPPACLATGKALHLLRHLLEGLNVCEERMLHNLAATRGFVYAERVMLALAPHLGKQSAHALVYRVAMAATERGEGLLEALLAEPEVREPLGAERLRRLFDPADSTGRCAEMVDRVLAAMTVEAPQ
ncbi:class-II fumarase/aspartase family protein [Methyloterricola oryzae]|uniref:class-II fumarase/aspartase family protein n=1 Tax=Methyloterricola oryzae TaxID=1495050 RepID=UPI0005EB3B5A|nr:adenylosuccinate lyase family protein [Methyloterricola oryzae]